jgi:hypothetical protein
MAEIFKNQAVLINCAWKLQKGSAELHSAASQNFILLNVRSSMTCEISLPCRLQIGDAAECNSALLKNRPVLITPADERIPPMHVDIAC